MGYRPGTLAVGMLLALGCCCAGGCKSWDWRQLQGPGLSEANNWSMGVRSESSSGRPAGMSRMAQDIEQNLGYY